MNTSLLSIIKWIVTKHGEDILGDPVRLHPVFANYVKNEPKEERVAFGRCIEMGSYKELKTARTEDERRVVKADLIQRLQSNTGLNTMLCTGALDLLDATLFGNVVQPQFPSPQKPPLPLHQKQQVPSPQMQSSSQGKPVSNLPIPANKTMAIFALVCGLLGASGIIANEWGLLVTLGFSILAIIFGAKAKKEAKATGEKSEMATTGWVMGIVFAVWNSIKIVFWLLLLFAISSFLRGCSYV